MAGEVLPPGENVDVENFDEFLDGGGVGGDVLAMEGEVIDVVGGVEVRNLTDTRNVVADVEDQGLDDPPGGENV